MKTLRLTFLGLSFLAFSSSYAVTQHVAPTQFDVELTDIEFGLNSDESSFEPYSDGGNFDIGTLEAYGNAEHQEPLLAEGTYDRVRFKLRKTYNYNGKLDNFGSGKDFGCGTGSSGATIDNASAPESVEAAWDFGSPLPSTITDYDEDHYLVTLPFPEFTLHKASKPPLMEIRFDLNNLLQFDATLVPTTVTADPSFNNDTFLYACDSGYTANSSFDEYSFVANSCGTTVDIDACTSAFQQPTIKITSGTYNVSL